VDLVRLWGYFDTVRTISDIAPGLHWSTSHLPGLPPCLGFSHISSTSFEIVSYYHVSICLAYVPPDVKEPETSMVLAILYSPHGIHAPLLNGLTESSLEVVALMHGLHEVWNLPVHYSFMLCNHSQHSVHQFLGGILNLGGLNAVRAVRATKARYWVDTHGEVKKGSGIVSYVLRRKAWTVEEALEAERKKDRDTGVEAGNLKYYVLGSGETLQLE
jgi:hypothetical protein